MEKFILLSKFTEEDLLKNSDEQINFERPRIVDIILDENGRWQPPGHLKYFKLPSLLDLPLDLKLGREKYIPRSGECHKSNLSKFEKYLVEQNEKAFLKKMKEKQQIITTRNVLQNVMHTPYMMMCDWSIKATKFGGIIYLVKKRDEAEQEVSEETYWHAKLHQYCFTDIPGGKLKTDELIDDNKQLFCILRNNVENFEILYSAEMAGVESDHEIKNLDEYELNKCNFVVTKLLQKEGNNIEWKNERRLRKSWIQCSLGSVDKTYVGRVCEDGLIRDQLELIETEHMTKNTTFKPNVCKLFLRDFLDKVKILMAGVDNPYTVYEFYFDSNMQALKYCIFEGKTENSFISEELIQHLQQK